MKFKKLYICVCCFIFACVGVLAYKLCQDVLEEAAYKVSQGAVDNLLEEMSYEWSQDASDNLLVEIAYK